MAPEYAWEKWSEGARDRALEVGINMLMGLSHADADVEANIIAGLGNGPILGPIYGTILTRVVQIPPALARQRLVLVKCYDEVRAFHSVLPGDVLGGRAATEHLLNQGCRRIGFINGQQCVDAARDRLKGYKQALSSPLGRSDRCWRKKSLKASSRDVLNDGRGADPGQGCCC